MDNINKLSGVLELAKKIHGAQNLTTSISVKNDETVSRCTHYLEFASS